MTNETINKMKRQPSEWEKIIANKPTNRGINFQEAQTARAAQYQEKTNSPIKAGHKTYIGVSPKNTYRWPRGT